MSSKTSFLNPRLKQIGKKSRSKQQKWLVWRLSLNLGHASIPKKSLHEIVLEILRTSNARKRENVKKNTREKHQTPTKTLAFFFYST
jgi:threonine synthase